MLHASSHPISSHTIRRIVAAALTLAERQSWPVSARRTLAPRLLQQLQSSPAHIELAQRLYPQAATPDALLFDIDPDALDPLPDWAVPLEALLATFMAEPSEATPCPEPQAMFAGVFAALIHFATTNLIESGQMPVTTSTLDRDHSSETAMIVQSARRYLQQRLLHLSGRTLATAFTRFKQTTTDTSGLYPAFIDHLRASAIIDLLLQYPVLARIWLTEIRSWQTTLQRLLQHFITDRTALTAHFPAAAAPLRAWTFGLSDPHQEGRTVCRATFGDANSADTSFSLAYKPRPVAIEAAYSRLMQDINVLLAQGGQDILPAERPLDVLARDDHGWVAWITPQPCPNAAAVARYYHRFGQTLALNQLLGIGDIHPENLIAQGEYPVQVDVEVAFRAPLARQVLPGSDGCTAALLDSILFTNMLAVWTEKTPGVAYDSSGWQRDTGATAQIPQLTWTGTGTDQIALQRTYTTVSPDHLPSLNGTAITPGSHSQEILKGMSSIHEPLAEGLIDKHRFVSIIAAHSAALPIRFVFRDTSQYTRLLEQLTSPSCHHSGLARSLAIAALAKAINPSSEARDSRTDATAIVALHQLVHQECAALEVNEVPYFECQSDATWVKANGTCIEGLFASSGLSHLQARIMHWSSADAQRQADWLLAAYAGRFTKEHVPVHPLISARARRHIQTDIDTPTLLRKESERIETLLQNTALYSDNDATGWIDAQAVGTTDRLQLHIMGAGLYDGLAGIALFLAMRLEDTDSAPTRQLLQGVLLNLHHQLTNSTLSAGWGNGLGGIAYVLAYIRSIEANSRADQMLAQLPQRVPAVPQDLSTENTDLLDGATGLVAGFSRAWQLCRQPALLTIARQWGESLLRHESTILTLLTQAHGASVAHGSAGLLIALRRLAQALAEHGDQAGSEQFTTAAKRLAPQINTVKARRGSGSWCHGQAGWLATGAGSLTFLRSYLQQHADPVPAHLCCGELGRLDALLGSSSRNSARHTAPTQLEVDLVSHRLGELIRHAARQGAYPFYLQAPQSLLPGLFTGVTGVGYLCERIRQTREGRFSPCVTGIF